jgi:hypothetical protein
MNAEFQMGNPEENGRIGGRRASWVDKIETHNQNLQEAQNMAPPVFLDKVKVLSVNISR